MKLRSKAEMAALMGILAAGSTLKVKSAPDRRVRNSNRMRLTDEELSHLETLSGKEKKKYVKELKLKYGK